MKLLLLPAGTAALGALAQTSPGGPDISPLAYWGIAGVLLSFVLWLFLDERKEHRALREKVLTDVLPALIANNEQMKESAAAVVMVHQLVGRPNVDPHQFSRWVRTLDRVERRLDDDDDRQKDR